MRDAVLCVFAVAMLLAPTAASAQDWSDAQKGVWSNVEAYWSAWAKGDVPGFFGYVHDDYLGWSTDSPVPQSKSSSSEWMSFWAANNSVAMYEITPLSILIRDDVAVVHYYYLLVYKDKDGDFHNEQGRWTDILVGQGDRWVVFADHGSSASGDDD